MRLADGIEVGERQARLLVQAHGASASAWLGALPQRLDCLTRLWNVSLVGLLHAGVESIVLSARAAGGETLVLKLMVDRSDFAAQLDLAPMISALPCVPALIAFDRGAHALLMERAPGMHPPDPSLVDDAVRAALADLHRLSGAGRMSLESYLRNRTTRARSRAISMGLAQWQIDALDQADTQMRELMGADTRRSLVHGDLHAANLLVADNGHISMIDAWGLEGSPSYDIATWLVKTAHQVADPLGRITPPERVWVRALIPNHAVSMQHYDIEHAWPALWDLHRSLS